MSTSAIDVTQAANTLLDFSRDDQQALLEVMADYSTSPVEGRDSDSDEDGTTDDQQADSASLCSFASSAVQRHHAGFGRPSRRIRRSSMRFWMKSTLGRRL